MAGSSPGGTRVGVIGTGTIANSVHIPVIHNLDDARLVWVADASDGQARKIASLNGTEAVSIDQVEVAAENCDVVLLATPLLPRAHYFEMLHGKGVTVLSEKPLALNGDDHRKYAQLFDEPRLSICYARRFHGTSRLLRDVMQRQPFGLPKSIRVIEGGRAGQTGGGGTYQDEASCRGGGITLNLACHALDCVFWIMKPTSYQLCDRDIEWDGNTDRRMRAQVLLKGVGGASGAETLLDIMVSNLDSLPNGMEFDFENLTLRCPVVASDQCEIVDKHGAAVEGLFRATQGARNSMESYYQLWRNIVSSHLRGEVSDASARSNLMVAELMGDLLKR